MPEYTLSTDSSGDASYQTDIGMEGILEGISLTYSGSTDAGCEVVIAEVEGLQRTLLTVTGNTNVTHSPFLQGSDDEGGALSVYFRPYIYSRISIVVSSGGADVANAVTVRLEFVRR